MMPILNALTDVIAGSRRVRESQERASARMYSGLDEKMKAIRDISPEGQAFETRESFSVVSSRTPSRTPPHERQGRPPLPRPELPRTQSEIPIQNQQSCAKAEFTPCITAMELNSEQMKRNYSYNDLQKWDRARSPLPPLYPMTGMGRYRTSVNADPQWRTEYFKKQVSRLDGLESMVAELDMLDVNGMSPAEWRDMTCNTARRGSGISSNSTHTTSSTGCQDFGNDAASGARVSRGFSPSASSSTRSSFNAHSRKGSTLSMITGAAEGEAPLSQKSLQRQSTAFSSDRRDSSPLSTISELHSNVQDIAHFAKKIEKPCDFSDTTNPDSAVASDADDDEDWVDDPDLAKVSAITQMLKEGRRPDTNPGLTRVRTTSSDKKRGRVSTTNIDRSRTIRSNATQSRRKKSKSQINLHQRVTSEEKRYEKLAPPLPSAECVDDTPELIMQIPNYAFKIGQQEGEDCDQNHDSGLVETQIRCSTRALRSRSNTAFHKQSSRPQEI